MSIINQIKKLIDGTEFSDHVKDKVKELVVKAELRRQSGKDEEECLLEEEKEELIKLIKSDMILDGLKVKTCQAYLDEIDRLIAGLRE